MFRSLYGKFAAITLILFVVIAALVVYAFERMLEGHRLLELATWLAVGGIAFALLAGALVFAMLTRRLMALCLAVDEFRASDFRRPPRLPQPDPNGDEIDRLAYAVGQMTDRMVAQLTELDETDTRRRELLANVSHDLRTPLTSMQGYLETLLLKDLPPAESRGYLEVAARHSERLGRLVGDLFQLTKLEAREIRIEPESFPLTELLQDVVQKFRLAAERRQIRLELSLPPQLPNADADIGLVERVLENLIDNALRHTPAGGIVRVDTELAGERLSVRIADTGHGIAPEDLPKVFERYYRVPRHENEMPAGTGLGLAIARHVVALHGGSIRVDSTVGAGTTFSFDLPARR